jgi:hypothetical protein
MDHRRLGEISAEISKLLEQQQELLQPRSIAKLSVEDLHTYAERTSASPTWAPTDEGELGFLFNPPVLIRAIQRPHDEVQ